MSVKDRWLLPEGIDELMPERAIRLEVLRRKLIDSMQSWGYQLVFPPLVEYLDALLTGSGKTLDLQTIKLIDQMSGRLMGVRADMTPQVARIAAHNLRRKQEITRLCYVGDILHTLPNHQGESRNPIQLGAELYGHIGPESDMEIIQLMVNTLMAAGASSNLLLDVGHVGVYRGLARYAHLNNEQEQSLFAALQRKALPEIESLLTGYGLADDKRKMLLSLAELNGDSSVLQKARKALTTAPDSVQQALTVLDKIAEMATKLMPEITINFDLAELRGYHYHTGIVFAVYQIGSAQAVATGGRYDDTGEVFGHAQPATGFSLDLKSLLYLLPELDNNKKPVMLPWSDDAAQKSQAEKLRRNGDTVIYQFSNEN